MVRGNEIGKNWRGILGIIRVWKSHGARWI